jgi:alpha-glucan,water dikinase
VPTVSAGDQMASRSRFGGDGNMVISFPPGVGEDVERIIGIVIRNDGADWLHGGAVH